MLLSFRKSPAAFVGGLDVDCFFQENVAMLLLYNSLPEGATICIAPEGVNATAVLATTIFVQKVQGPQLR